MVRLAGHLCRVAHRVLARLMIRRALDPRAFPTWCDALSLLTLIIVGLYASSAHATTWDIQMQASALTTLNHHNPAVDASESCTAYVDFINPNFSANFKWSTTTILKTFAVGMSGGQLCTITQNTSGTVKTVNFSIWSEDPGCPAPLVEDPETGLCVPPPPECPPERIGEKKVRYLTLDDNAQPPQMCEDDCLWIPSGPREGSIEHNQRVLNWTCSDGSPACDSLTQWYVNAGNCYVDTPTDDELDEEIEDGATCGSVNGQTYCHSPKESNCGTVNGQEVCMDKVPDGRCILIPGGSYVCDADAPVPPAPNNGNEGQLAEPDLEFSVGGDFDGTGAPDPNSPPRDINFFSSTTVQNSTQPVIGDQVEGAGGGSNFGEGSDSEEPFDPTADDSAGGGGTCASAPTCDGDPIQCVILHQTWLQRCSNENITAQDAINAAGLGDVPLDGSAISQGSVDVGSGFDDTGYGLVRQCPADMALNLGMFGQHVLPLSGLCTLAQLLGVLIMMGAAIASVRIVAGGF